MNYVDEPIDPSRFNLSPTEQLAAWVNAHWLALVVGSAALGTFVVWALLLVARVSYGATDHWAATLLWASAALGLLIVSLIEGDDAGPKLKICTALFACVAFVLAGSTAAEVFS